MRLPNGKPVTKWENRDEAWTEVALALKLRVKEVLTLRLQATVPDCEFSNSCYAAKSVYGRTG
jgi:hypothetical protein